MFTVGRKVVKFMSAMVTEPSMVAEYRAWTRKEEVYEAIPLATLGNETAFKTRGVGADLTLADGAAKTTEVARR